MSLCGLTALAGCANNMAEPGDADRGLHERSGNTLNVNDQRADIYNRDDRGMRDRSEDFGYIRHQKTGIMGQDTQRDHYAWIDREEMADIIGLFCTDVPEVDDVSTLVTDEEVLIIYNTDSDDRFQTADQVKKMAMSVVPRWYHVYVSDNTNLRKDVENFATLDSDSRNIETLVNGVITQMLQSPQGRNLNEGENANGEAKGEMNDNIDKDDLAERLEENKIQNDANNNNNNNDNNNNDNNLNN